MNILRSLKCAVILAPVLAMGLPMAHASDEKRNDSHEATTHHHFLETMPVGGYRSDSLIGQEVMNRNNDESIGKIDSLLLDQDNQVVAVVISVGGMLGIGKRDVAIAFDQIERRVDGDETTLWANLTEQNLKDAPVYGSETALSRRDQRRSDRTDQRQAATPPEEPAADSARSDAAETSRHHYLETMPVRGYHSGSLVGHDLKSRTNNETIGTVSNLLLDETGQVVAIVVGVGGLMGLGERDVAIAWDQVERSFDGDEVTLWVNQTEEHLKNAPDYSIEATRPAARR